MEWRGFPAVLLLSLALLASCREDRPAARPASEPPVAADTSAPAAAPRAEPAAVDTAAPAAPPARAPADSPAAGPPTAAGTRRDTAAAAGWTVTPSGIGRVRVGMTVEEASAALGGRLNAPDVLTGCDYAFPTQEPSEVAFMMLDGRVGRVDVRNPSIATDRGARIGDDEARIEALYPGHVEVQPHKYTDGHYLVVTPAAPADSLYRIIFETDGAKVTEYRAGALPQVAWVEGCS